MNYLEINDNKNKKIKIIKVTTKMIHENKYVKVKALHSITMRKKKYWVFQDKKEQQKKKARGCSSWEIKAWDKS